MKVAHLVSHGGLNGVATSSRALIAAQIEAGHEVALVTRPRAWVLGNLPRDRLLVYETEFPTSPREMARIGYSLQDWGVEIAHCHGSRANKYGLVYQIMGRAPVVATGHTPRYQLPWLSFSAVFAPSRAAHDYYASRWLVRRKRLHVAYNIVEDPGEPPMTPEARQELRARFGFSDEHFVIGSVGAICQRKNQVEALRILKRLVRELPQARLLLVGGLDGQEPMPGWNAALADEDVRPRVVLAGAVDHADRLSAAFDAFLFVSREETGPIAPLEAMLRGVPIVTYEVGILPEIIKDGENGFIVRQMDRKGATMRLIQLADGDFAARIGRAGAEVIRRHFASRAIQDEVAGVYRSLVDRGRPRR